MTTPSFSISSKWPAARLVGPRVSVENALEFIRRTDPVLVSLTPEIHTNDREFVKKLISAFPLVYKHYDDVFNSRTYNHALHETFERYRENFGFIPLNHLDSHWVASAYIGGPHGPVHPDGTVWLDIDFGKWPNAEEVEEDLDAITKNFPWLSFVLVMWDREWEENKNFMESPCCVWEIINSQVIRSSLDNISDADRKALQLTPHGLNIEKVTRRIGMGLKDHETTWTVPEIVKMWGKQINAAFSAAQTINIGDS